MALQDDLNTAVQSIVAANAAEHTAVQKFITDVTALINTQGNPALITGVQNAVAALNAQMAQIQVDTTALGTADTATTTALGNVSGSTSTAAAASGSGAVSGTSTTGT